MRARWSMKPVRRRQAAAKASKQVAWTSISVGTALASAKSWLEANSLEDYDLSAW